MYSVYICEQSKVVRNSLEKVLSCYFSTRGIRVQIRCFSRPEQLQDISGSNDIVFLDIDSNSEASINTAYMLQKKNPQMYLYILSQKYSYLDYAMDLKAFRYLSKRLDVDRIILSLDIVTSKEPEIVFMSNYTQLKLKASEIVCIYSNNRKTIVLTDDGIKYPTTASIKEWLIKVARYDEFIHPHYSYIVNKTYITEFIGNTLVLRCKNGKVMNVYPSQRRISEIRNILMSNYHYGI